MQYAPLLTQRAQQSATNHKIGRLPLGALVRCNVKEFSKANLSFNQEDWFVISKKEKAACCAPNIFIGQNVPIRQ